MLKYILKRVAIFLPTLVVISLCTFMLSTNVPGDPVEQLMNSGSKNEMGQSTSKQASEIAYIEKRKEFGLHLPIFYFSLSNQATPDSLHVIPKKLHKENLERLIAKYGNWDKIYDYYQSIKKTDYIIADITKDSLNTDAIIKARDEIFRLYINHEEPIINSSFEKLKSYALVSTNMQSLAVATQQLENAYLEMKKTATPYKNFIPTIHWYGLNNQYHKWVTKFIKGDFGTSYQDRRPVSSVLKDAMGWTLLLSVLSIILSYLIAIPLGVLSAKFRSNGKRQVLDQTINTFLFMLYSLPSFWIATMLIMFFGGGDYFDWFPTYGVGEWDDSVSFFANITDRAYHLVLPLLCMTYGSLAFLSRQMRGSMITALTQDYVRTARAKGLDEKKVVWYHAFRNSLLPIITLFASVFPLAISGSIVLEVIFNINGMGKVAVEAIFARNYPMVYTVVMLSAILTLLGYLVADILYAVVDPRISYSKK
jgi:peptide/nickel transport system permease protein